MVGCLLYSYLTVGKGGRAPQRRAPSNARPLPKSTQFLETVSRVRCRMNRHLEEVVGKPVGVRVPFAFDVFGCLRRRYPKVSSECRLRYEYR